ncbi:MAG: response regulator transcription factor [Chloroflexota bacterium]
MKKAKVERRGVLNVSTTRILIVDSHPTAGYSLALALNTTVHFETQTCFDYDCIAEKLSIFSPQIVILNLHSQDIYRAIDLCQNVTMSTHHSMVMMLVPPSLLTDTLVAQAIEAGVDGVLSHEELEFTDLVQAIEKVNEGQSLFTTQQIRDALIAKRRVNTTVIDLTPREQEIAGLLIEGASTVEIADILAISHRTVYAHTGNIMSKLEVGSRGEAIARLYQMRMQRSIE